MICERLLSERKLPNVWAEDGLNWETRRQEIKELLQREVYGFRPGDPEELTFTELPVSSPDKRFCAGKAPLRKIEIRGKLKGREFHFPMYAVIPSEKKNLPFFVHINFRPDVPDKYMPTEELIDNGFAVFSFGYKDVTSDNGDMNDGLAGTIYGDRQPEAGECGKIAMWSWAASRVMDYCQTLDCLDLSRAAVIGHSRLGKTALFTGMMDERFRFVISNNSGSGGAAIARGKAGERVEDCYRTFPYWYTPGYEKYAGKEDQMLFDQHFLLAACAPRYVYVASAVEDTWADPDSEYLSCCAASEVYERLGLSGFVHPDRLPQVGDVFHKGNIAYHMRAGAHYLSREDWNHYMRFII